MKKIKLIATSLFASALALSGCGKCSHVDKDNNHKCDKCGETISQCVDEDHNHLCDVCGTGPIGTHADGNGDGKCDYCNGEIVTPTPTNPSVESVSVSGEETVMVGKSSTYSANVVVKNGASRSVTWSVDKPELGTISEEGVLTTIAPGTIVVTATSVFDPTKKGSITVTIQAGFDPSYIEEGYTFSTTFPVEAIKAFLGEGEYEIIVPEKLDGGCYYKVGEADGQYIAYIEIITDGVLYEDYAYGLFEEGFERVYQSSYGGYEAVDPTGKYTVSMMSGFDEETYEDAAPTVFKFYKSEDAWDSSKKTTDTAWDLTKIVNTDEAEIAKAKEWVSKIPFVALGEDYKIEYVLDDSLKEEIISFLELLGLDVASISEEELAYYLEMFGYTGPEAYLTVYDYSLCEPFEGYEEALLEAGFAHIEYEDEDGYYDYYEIGEGLIAYDISFGFSESGNTIYLEEGVATLSEFPLTEANNYIKDVIGSENSIIAYEGTEGVSFQAVVGDLEMSIWCEYATLEEAQKYASALEEAGFEIEYTPASDEYYPSWVATKGKLVVEFYLEQAIDEETEEYLDEGALEFFIYADETKHEEQGIYLPESASAIIADGEFVLDLEIVKLEDPTLVVESSNTEVATVDGLKVTPVADGETTITVTIPETEFSASMKLTVSSKTRFESALEEANKWLEECGVEEELVLPLPTGGKVKTDEDYYYDEDYECYTIMVTGETDDVAYLAQLEAAGFEIGEDEYGDFAYLGDVIVSPWMYEEGVLEIDIYYSPESASEGAIFDFTEITLTSATVGGVSFDTAKASGQSAPAYNANRSELRLYANNTITFTSDEAMTSIFFDANTCGESKATGSFVKASVGSVSKVEGGFLWEGDASEVTLTVSGSGQIHINSIEVNGGGSGEGGGGGGQTTALEAFADEVSEAIFGEAGVLEYDSEYDEYYCAYLSEQTTLMAACEEICSYLQGSYTEYQAPTAGSDEDGDYVDACYYDGDYEIYVVTYEVEEGIVFQIEVYEAE